MRLIRNNINRSKSFESQVPLYITAHTICFVNVLVMFYHGRIRFNDPKLVPGCCVNIK